MSVILITYDLNRPGQNYPKIKEYIDKFAWAKLSESSYAIETNKTPNQVFSDLKNCIDSNDTLYVITLTAPWDGRGRPEVNQWLSERLNRVYSW